MVYVYTCNSRNKDNQNVPGFKQRAYGFICDENDESKAYEKFERFVSDGVLGEKSRLYKTINPRDEERTKRELIVELLRNPSVRIQDIKNRVVGIAAKSRLKGYNRLLFDFDIDDAEQVAEFCDEIEAIADKDNRGSIVSPEVFKTPHGYAVVVQDGFNYNKLSDKWKNGVEYKGDGMLFLMMKEKV